MASGTRTGAGVGGSGLATAGLGRIAAIGLSPADVEHLLAAWPGVELAGVNSDRDVTVSGRATSLVSLGEELANRDVFFREHDLDYPFHSSVMDRAEATQEAVLELALGHLPAVAS